MMHYFYNYNYLGFNFIFMIIFWLAVIILTIILVQKLLDKNRGHEGTNGKALDILDERYARGEIDKNEYEERKKHLNSGLK